MLHHGLKVAGALVLAGVLALAFIAGYSTFTAQTAPHPFSTASCQSTLAPEPGRAAEIQVIALAPQQTVLIWIDRVPPEQQFAGLFLSSSHTMAAIGADTVALVQLDAGERGRSFSVMLSIKGAAAGEEDAHCLLVNGPALVVDQHLAALWPASHPNLLLWASAGNQPPVINALGSLSPQIVLVGADTVSDLAYIG